MKIDDKVVQLIDKADLFNAKKTLLDWIELHQERKLVEGVIIAILHQVGQKCVSTEGVSLAQAYVASEVVAAAIEKIAQDQEKEKNTAPRKGPVVLANIEDDFHSLGRRMLATILEANQWEVVDMGNDVPAEQVVDKAVEVGARVIGVSAMMHTTALNIKKVREELDKRSLSSSIKLAVGGAVFTVRPELVEEVGGDGTCKTALSVPLLMDELWEQSLQEEYK